MILCRKREARGKCTHWAWRHHSGADCCRKCARRIRTPFQDLCGERAHVKKDQTLRIVAHWRSEGGGGRGCTSRREPRLQREIECRFSGTTCRLRCVSDSFTEWIYRAEFIGKGTRLMPNRANNA